MLLLVFCAALAPRAGAQSLEPGRQIFVSRCASCHGSDGNGGELGPAIVTRVPARTDADLTSLFRQGLPTAGMPAFPTLRDQDIGDLIRYVRERFWKGPTRATRSRYARAGLRAPRATRSAALTLATARCSR